MGDEEKTYSFSELSEKAKQCAMQHLIEEDDPWAVQEDFDSLDRMMKQIGCDFKTYSYDGVTWKMWLTGGTSWGHKCCWPNEPEPIESDGYFIGEGMAQEFNKRYGILKAIYEVMLEQECESTEEELAYGAYEHEYLKAADMALQSACRDITAECEWRLTEEYWAETCDANEWRFDEEGMIV